MLATPGRRRTGWLQWRHWPRDTRDTLFQLAVIALTVAPHLWHLPLWCGLLTAVVLGWRTQIALAGRNLPGRWPVLAVLLGAVAATLATERTLLGREAGLTLLVLLLALKTLELRARRDAMVVFFLGFFLVLTNALYSQSLGITLAMLAATWGLLTALVLSNMPVGRPPLWQAARLAARSALWGLPLMALLFVLFPRFGPLWSLPQDSVGRTGLSGTLRMGGVADLANDDSIAFRIRFDGAAPPPQELYFRGPVLSRFDGLEWQAGLRSAWPPPQDLDLQLAGAPQRYEVLFEPIRLAVLPLLEATRPDSLQLQPQGETRPWLGHDLQWQAGRLISERLRVQGQAHTRFQHGLDLAPLERLALTRLPVGFNPRALAWAQQTRRQLPQADARTLAAMLQAQIRQGNYVYTMTPRLYGREAVDEFWFDGREGFCEHFATAFVVMMRGMGVPARVVTGYQGAEPPDADGFRVVRQSHAHAWAEFWQAGEGWLRADPTAAVAPERVRASRPLPPRPGFVAGALRTMSPALAAQLRQAWELMDSRWTQWIMGWSRSQQMGLLKGLGFDLPDWTQLLRLLVGALSTLALAAAGWAWWDRHRQDPWQRLQQRLVAALQRAGLAARPHHGPRTLAGLLARLQPQPAAAELTQALLELERLRYAPAAGAGVRTLRAPPKALSRRLLDAAGRLTAPT
ncbi:MAG: DUF3488 domain-containing transglutaminase family protein [Burkholderiaceae bacterium]|nr:DUF3488 domain-containing transglutaminase family protein [Burkholderiaceae bacterium]